MCDNNKTRDCDNCIADILKVINILQQNAMVNDKLAESCDRPTLGCAPANCECNTRPIMLYTCSGDVWSFPTTKEPINCTEAGSNCSMVFRIEKIDGCCATFRVLTNNPDTNSNCPYIATESFFTINLNCICAIKCLDDTFVECL